MSIAPGEIFSLLGATARAGRNAQGLMGWCADRRAGAPRRPDLAASAPTGLLRVGIAYVPEEREISQRTVDENCASACKPPRPACDMDGRQMFTFFPQLRDRRTTAAGMLSAASNRC